MFQNTVANSFQRGDTIRHFGLDAEELGVLMGSAATPGNQVPGITRIPNERLIPHLLEMRCRGGIEVKHEKVNFGTGLKLSFSSLDQFSPKLKLYLSPGKVGFRARRSLLVHCHLNHAFMKRSISR